MAASPQVAAKQDLNATQPRLTSLQTQVGKISIPVFYGFIFLFNDRLRGNYNTSTHTELMILTLTMYGVCRQGYLKGKLNHCLSLMFLNIIHEEILSKVAVWRSAIAQRKQTFLVVNNGKQTGVNNGNEATCVKWAAPGSARHKPRVFLHKGVLLIQNRSERVVQLIGKDSSVSKLQEDAVFLGGKINKASFCSAEPPGKQVSLRVAG